MLRAIWARRAWREQESCAWLFREIRLRDEPWSDRAGGHWQLVDAGREGVGFFRASRVLRPVFDGDRVGVDSDESAAAEDAAPAGGFSSIVIEARRAGRGDHGDVREGALAYGGLQVRGAMGFRRLQLAARLSHRQGSIKHTTPLFKTNKTH